MKRTQPPQATKADAILCADMHLREDNPTCRTDVFVKTLINKLIFLRNLQRQHDCPVYHAGDLFHRWKPSPYLLTLALRYLPEQFHTIYGNHDLPQHNMELVEKTGVKVLEEAGKIKILDKYHWNETPGLVPSCVVKGRKIAVWHVFTYEGKAPWPDCPAPGAESILKKYGKPFDLILTGDNHTPFVIENKDTLLVNPGSFTRQTADQAAYRPRVYLYYAKDNNVVPIYIPIEKQVITSEHLRTREERNERIEAFISRLKDEYETGLGFEENLERFFAVNQIRQSVKDIIYKALDNSN